jgi:Dolichyl-phosphate-mannose-protein mannosyltransferase
MSKRPLTLWFAAIGVLASRFFLLFHYRFDSDEPQHMHVAWGWAHGLMQYRDIFDNHMPLFHLLSAPLFAVGGDDPRLLFAARMLMVPLFVASIALIWLIARALFEVDTAIWAAALAAITPPFFLGTLEYRTDDLWIVCWLAALAICVSRLAPQRKSAFAGLAIGLAFGVSMKTTLFVIAITAAAMTTALLMRDRGALRGPRAIGRWLVTFVVCAAVVPLAIFGAFAAVGAWGAFQYGVFAHNVFPFQDSHRLLFVIPLYLIVRNIAVAIAKSEGADGQVRRRLFIFLAGAIYLTVLVSFWPMMSLESYLPFYPVAAICVAPLLRPRPVLVRATCALALIFAIAVMGKPWRDDARDEIAMIDEVLMLTTPDEPVMDLKGETVFRPRPWYFSLEAITNVKLRLGRIRDDIAYALVRSRTHVVVSDSFPPHARRFIEENYVSWGTVRVAGVRLRGAARMPFRLGIPGRYVVITRDGRLVQATIDHCEVRNGIELAPGDHELEPHDPIEEATVIWCGVLRARRSSLPA